MVKQICFCIWLISATIIGTNYLINPSDNFSMGTHLIVAQQYIINFFENFQKNDMQEDIRRIQEGYFNECPNQKIDALVNNYFANPKWNIFIGKEYRYVSFIGTASRNNKDILVLMGFQVTSDREFNVSSLFFDKEEQNGQAIDDLIKKMCKNTTEK